MSDSEVIDPADLIPDLPPTDVMVRSWLGPRLVTAFLISVETGIIINQSLRFWTDAHSERIAIRILVAWVTIIALFHTCALIWDAWYMFIINFSDFRGAYSPTWVCRAGNLIVALMAVPVQVFYTWRCWRLTNYRIVLIFLSLLCLAYFVSMMRVTVYLFRFNFEWAFELDADALAKVEPWRPDPYVVTSLVVPATLDVCITSILLFFLLKSKPEHMTRRFQRIIRRLIVLIWEAAVPPCACAIVALATYLTMIDSFWSLLFQTVLGQLYVISLFVSLNGFKHMKRRRIGISPTTALAKDEPMTYSGDLEMQVTLPEDNSTSSYIRPPVFGNSVSIEPQNRDIHTIDLSMVKDNPLESIPEEKSSLKGRSSTAGSTSGTSTPKAI